MSGIGSGKDGEGTSNLIPRLHQDAGAIISSNNGIIAEGATVGETVTDSTVNVVADFINTNGTNVGGLAQSTAANALNQLQIASNFSAATDSVAAAFDSFNLDVLIPSKIWTLQYWEKYLASYGVALGDFNIGMARAMQKDVGNTSTDCFLKALHSSNAIKNTFDVNFYTNASFNFPDL